MSLDGYVAGPNQSIKRPLGEGGEQLHEWAFAVRTFRERHGMEGGSTGPDDDIATEYFQNAPDDPTFVSVTNKGFRAPLDISSAWTTPEKAWRPPAFSVDPSENLMEFFRVTMENVPTPAVGMVLIKAAINGTRTRMDHPAIPMTSAQQACEAAAAAAAGAGRFTCMYAVRTCKRAWHQSMLPAFWKLSAAPASAHLWASAAVRGSYRT
jgi:hypothetical protein